MLKTVIVVLLVAVAIAQSAPPRPQISEVFMAKVRIELKEAQNTHWGNGHYAVDQPDGKAVEKYNFEGEPQLDRHFLQRYDKNATYEIGAPSNHSECRRHPVDGSMPAIWGWVASAVYKGQRNYHNKVYDTWEFTAGHATMWLAVTPGDPNTPVWVGRNSTQREFNIVFDEFSTTAPHPAVFDIPHQCPNTGFRNYPSSTVGCVARSTMIGRGQVWVDRHVPYNQGATYDGYREDCSGYVSMCWELSKPGYTTFTLPKVSHEISKGELQPGDVLLDVQEHVVLFKGWANGEHSAYISMEETRPGEGTVERQTPYPYWYNQAAFIPHRYNGVC